MSYESIASNVLEQVKKAGATGDLLIDTQQSLSLKCNQGKLDEHKVSSSQIFGLRVIDNQKVGIAYSEADDADSIDSMVQQALQNARYSKVDEHTAIVDDVATLRSDEAWLCPEDTTSIDEKIEFALQLEDALLQKEYVKNCPYNGVTDQLSQQYVYSTSGLSAFQKSRGAVAYAYALAENGEKNAMCGTGQLYRDFADLDKTAIAEEAYAETVAMLDGEPIASGHYDVIFDCETQNDLFGVFTAIFSGKWAQDGLNPWREKVGKLVAESTLTLFDNPLNKNGFGYSIFDAEGVATASTPLLENGVLKTLIHNSATANFYQQSSTGHATRGAKSNLGVGIHQMEIAAGETSSSDLYAGDLVVITDLSGLHAGANPISGDFSFGASGYLYRNGEKQQAIRGITVAGNFYTMLDAIETIGDTQYWNWQKGSLMPSIRFSQLTISGS
ncbi:MAG: TldE protein, part of TldE/TldD proteolytic complex [uncultured Thiotrichaceae bacterium]|uniref:TldE protein, part of TldE/TldD proteolytic complex n=1 Tax=uncultured Thiotrichaceae bacterium TaxID=298394 RepID=A0A6S6SBQ5_9GAMM|nr:MAG: TldE protein, part of TldE/TldD proteolytic complex [uncultured Thiotrichaceae bacterium]